MSRAWQRALADVVVPGRLERCDGPADDMVVVVDYAHTPDALERVLAALDSLRAPPGAAAKGAQGGKRLLCVFGCGGDRDPSKREPMGRAVAQWADVAIVTTDNARSEDPAAIAAAILPGLAGAPSVVVELDRARAIAFAVARAKPGDVLLIAGKGHETYQIVGGESRHFDDREEARRALAARRQAAGREALMATAIPPNLRSFHGRRDRACDRWPHRARRTRVDRRVHRLARHHDRTRVRGAHRRQVRRPRFPRQSRSRSARARVVVSRDDIGEPLGACDARRGSRRDTRAALGALARAHRSRWASRRASAPASWPSPARPGRRPPSRCSGACSSAMAPGTVHATAGNLNNDIGVPMTLFGLAGAQHYAVVEVGTNARGEIGELARHRRSPTWAVLTLVAAAHTEGLGSIDDVAVEKGALLAALPTSGLAVANADDARAVAQLATLAGRGDASPTGSRTRPTTASPSRSRTARGAIGCASARRGGRARGRLSLARRSGRARRDRVARRRRVGRRARRQSGEHPRCTVAAWRTRRTAACPCVPLGDGTLVIDDSYNANPASMDASLRAACEVAAREKRRLVVVLGEMRELGAMSTREHDKLGQVVARADVAEVIGVGGEAERVTREAARAGKSAWFAFDAEQAIGTVLSRVLPGDVVLVKGSRGVATEKIVRALVQARGRAAAQGGAA